MGTMTATTKNLLDKIASWPPEDQEELAQYAREIEARRIGVYRLNEAEQQGIERGLKAMREGKFASDERVAAILKKARSSHT
jgi:predicted transcriptional regulator